MQVDIETKKYRNDDDIYITITLTFNVIKITYSADKLINIPHTKWLDLLNINGKSLRLNDGYGSHCDNGDVSITNYDGKLCFNVDTATGGEISVTLPVEDCREAITKISDTIALLQKK